MHQFSKEFVQAIHATWQAIAPDLIASLAACGEEVDNYVAVESCIDADRIVVFGGETGPRAQQEFRSRVREIGYEPALRDVMAALPHPLM